MANLVVYFVVFITLSIAATAAPPETITIYAYHSAPPFEINRAEEKGLNFDLMRTMQKSAPAALNFQYQYIARTELNHRLASGEPAIVLWANPAWFEQNTEPNYLWSTPLFWDKDVLVGLKGSHIQYRTIDDLNGLRLGGRAGYHYTNIDDIVEKKLLLRLDSSSDRENIQQLLNGNVDIIIISKSNLLYYAKSLQLLDDIVIIGKPHSNYTRHLLITKHYQKHYDTLNKILNELAQDEHWRSRLSIYGLQNLWTSSTGEYTNEQQ